MAEHAGRAGTVPGRHGEQVLDVRASRRALIAGSLGNLVEWDEFWIYA